MADNVTIANPTSSTPGDTLAFDEIGGVKYGRSKITLGADGVNGGDVSAANPLPVAGNTVKDGSGTVYTFLLDADGHLQVDVLTAPSTAVTNGGTFPVQAAQSGVWSITGIGGTISLPTGASTLTEQQSQTTLLGTIDADTSGIAVSTAAIAVDAAAIEVLLTTIAAGQLADSHNVTIDNASLPVTGTFWQATQPISGTITANAGTGNFTVMQSTASSLNATVVGTGTFAVQVSSALPSGTNAIGKLAANSGVDIGDVDILSVIPGTGATNLGKAIDTPAGATDTGIAALAVRDDSLSALTPAEGDYVPLRVNSTGALHVTGGGGGTQYAVDDVAGGTDTGTLLLVIRDDSLSALAPADGDYTGLRVSSTGALHVTGGGGGTEYTEDVATANPIVGTATMMERDDVLATLTPVEGDWAAMRCTAEGAMWVEDFNSEQNISLLSSIAGYQSTISTNSGTQVSHLSAIDGYTSSIAGYQSTISSNSTSTVSYLSSLDGYAATIAGWDNTASDGASVTGDVAHDGVDAGEPIKIGYRAIAHGTNPTAVAAADRTNAYANRAGVPFVIGGHPNPVTITVTCLAADGAQTNTAIVTVSAGTKICVTHLMVTADDSNTNPVDVKVGFAAATLATPTTTAGAALLANFLGVPAGSGFSKGDGGGLLGVGADGEDLRYTCESPAGGSISITATYFTIES